MKDVGGLANPDPTDTASWSGEPVKPDDILVDEGLEDSKAKLKRQAQNWAGFVNSLHMLLLSFAVSCYSNCIIRSRGWTTS